MLCFCYAKPISFSLAKQYFSFVLSSNLCIIILKHNSVILGIVIVRYKYRGYASFRSDRILSENRHNMSSNSDRILEYEIK